MAIISPATGDKICLHTLHLPGAGSPHISTLCTHLNISPHISTLHLPVAGSTDEAEKTWESRQQQEVDAGHKDELDENQRWRDCENIE